MQFTTFLWLITVFAAAATQEPSKVDRKTVTQVAARTEAPGAEVAPNPRELLERYRQASTNWDKSVSMRIEFEHSLVYQGRDFRHWKYDLTHRRDGDRCEWFGRSHFEGKHDGDAYSFNEEFRHLVLDDYYLYYSKRDPVGDSDAVIGPDVKEWLDEFQRQSVDGGFLQGRTGGIGKATHLAEAMAESNELRYVGQETIGGIVCHVVEARTKYGTFTVWLAPEKGYNALKYFLHKNSEDLLYENIRTKERGIVECTETVEAVEVRQINGVFVPVSGRLTDITKYRNAEKDEEHKTAQRREIVLHPDFKALKAFQIGLPEGTEVRLHGVPLRRFRWSNGKFTPDINKYLMRSLLGKSLPRLDNIHSDWNPISAPGEMLVVCFFDMNQRSSRNCMAQLARKAGLLAKQRAILCGIQAGQVEKDELREWLQKNGINAPVGTIQTDEEETRCAWGVRAMPWLILTDRKQVVRAEGFSLDELESRIELVGKE